MLPDSICFKSANKKKTHLYREIKNTKQIQEEKRGGKPEKGESEKVRK